MCEGTGYPSDHGPRGVIILGYVSALAETMLSECITQFVGQFISQRYHTASTAVNWLKLISSVLKVYGFIEWTSNTCGVSGSHKLADPDKATKVFIILCRKPV